MGADAEAATLSLADADAEVLVIGVGEAWPVPVSGRVRSHTKKIATSASTTAVATPEEIASGSVEKVETVSVDVDRPVRGARFVHGIYIPADVERPDDPGEEDVSAA